MIIFALCLNLAVLQDIIERIRKLVKKETSIRKSIIKAKSRLSVEFGTIERIVNSGLTAIMMVKMYLTEGVR